jgi:hypothetical protein
MFILYTIVDKCNHCSPVNTSSIADGIFNSLNKVFIIIIINVVCVSASHAQRPCALIRITFVFGSNTCVSLGKHLLRAEDHAFTLSICGHDLYSCLLHHSTYVVIFRSV